nr:hypothetical protein [Streptomyces sp. LBUM 1477]
MSRGDVRAMAVLPRRGVATDDHFTVDCHSASSVTETVTNMGAS